MSWLKGIYSSAVLLLLSATVCAADNRQIVIVKSSDNSYFNQTIDTLINHVDRALRFKIVMADSLGEAAQDIHPHDLHIALGQPSVEAISALGGKWQVINAYLTLEQHQRLQIDKRHLSVLLDQPLQRYLAFSKMILQIDSIGIISDTAADPGLQQSPVLGQMDLELNQYRVDGDNKLLPVLRRLLSQNDALLMLPRQSIYNRESLKGVLLTSYRNRKPVISYSPAHVKSGAVASIFSSPVDIGRHLAIVVNQQLRRQKRSGPGYQFARYYSISTNPRVAHSLGLTLPDEVELRSRLDRLNQ